MLASNPRDPLIAIVGATGTGKSQLAVDLALKYNGEIINADAMQLYDGLSIITNKIPVNERKGVPHHLLGCVSLEEQPWRADKFVRRALQTIAEIRNRGRLPILVGGTHYYTQSLLFRESLVGKAEEDGDQSLTEGEQKEDEPTWSILNGPVEAMLAKLKEVDPIMAARWHPNDTRKIRRSLEIWLQKGKRASDVYVEQEGRRQAVNGIPFKAEQEDQPEPLAAGLRFPTLVLWVHVPKDLVANRLNDRVDKMMQAGLLQEARDLEEFACDQQSAGKPVDRSRGIYAAVGYKEFQSLFDALEAGVDDTDELKRLELDGVEKTKTATRRYAKTQLRWIRIKLVNALQEAGAAQSIMVLDASDLAHWSETVLEPAVKCIKAFLAGQPLPNMESEASSALLSPLRDYDLGRRRELWKQQTCEACQVTAVTEEDWQKHIHGHRHRQIAKKLLKKLSRPEPPTATADSEGD